jgi:hypothetical protein
MTPMIAAIPVIISKLSLSLIGIDLRSMGIIKSHFRRYLQVVIAYIKNCVNNFQESDTVKRVWQKAQILYYPVNSLDNINSKHIINSM